MSAKAYVLIETEGGQVGVIEVALHQIPAVRTVNIVTDPMTSSPPSRLRINWRLCGW